MVTSPSDGLAVLSLAILNPTPQGTTPSALSTHLLGITSPTTYIYHHSTRQGVFISSRLPHKEVVLRDGSLAVPWDPPQRVYPSGVRCGQGSRRGQVVAIDCCFPCPSFSTNNNWPSRSYHCVPQCISLSMDRTGLVGQLVPDLPCSPQE